MTRSSRAAVAVAALAAVAGAWWLWSDAAAPRWPAHAVPRGNVLLVTIDTLRADRLTDRVMPRLSVLAREGRRFDTAYAHAPLTLPSHVSLLTGLLPPAHGVRGNGVFRLDDAHVTLAERLHLAGYRTGAFVGAFVLDSRFGLAQGFERYEGVDDARAFAADFGFTERRAPQVIEGAERWILDADPRQPWFAWVHLFDPHAPYDAPTPAGLGPYDDEVRFTDERLGTFLERLGARGALAKTLVIVTADHGEGLGEHGESTHGLFAYDSTMRVPLVVSGPGIRPGVSRSPVALVDVVPTVLEAVGLEADPLLPGRPLREAASGAVRAIYLEAFDGWLTAGAAPVTALVREGLKFVDVPEPELYDLAADPAETRNLVDAQPERARPLADGLRALVSARSGSGPAALDRDAEARLRSLGYASGGQKEWPDRFDVADDPKRVRPLYERFLDELGTGAGDVTALRALVDERPAFEAARLAAASLLIDQGRGAEAVTLLEPAVVEGHASQALTERLGAAYLAAGQPLRAVEVLDRAVSAPGASADAWNGLGVARAALGQTDRALAAFDEAARLAPDALRIGLNLVVARVEAGQPGRAAELVRSLLARHPGAADGWRLLATLEHEAGRREHAIEAWRRALALDGSDFDTLFNLAVTLAETGGEAEARTLAARFLAGAPRPRYDREAAMLERLLAR